MRIPEAVFGSWYRYGLVKGGLLLKLPGVKADYMLYRLCCWLDCSPLVPSGCCSNLLAETLFSRSTLIPAVRLNYIKKQLIVTNQIAIIMISCFDRGWN